MIIFEFIFIIFCILITYSYIERYFILKNQKEQDDILYNYNEGDFLEKYKDEIEIKREDILKDFMPKNLDISTKHECNISNKDIILSAIFGDISGMPYEFAYNYEYKPMNKDFPFFENFASFTDDTVLTIATLDSLKNNLSYKDAYCKWASRYPNVGYGGLFIEWLKSKEKQPYYSYGNGSAMRISPIAIIKSEIEDILLETYESAICTHNHYEGVKGACVTAVCIYLAKHFTKEDIVQYMNEQYPDNEYFYSFNLSFDEMKNKGKFKPVTCQSTVPFSIKAAIESTSYTDFLEKINEAGQDTDTDAIIGGPIAFCLNRGLFNFDSEKAFNMFIKDEEIKLLINNI